eukprot:GHVO01024834.1.p1 GENE.GHVO01024834.1~~GHVO01024834.1.p1  ORF type:complete len:146 (+),score=1.00 GHVO01024834.1:76-513(+)
MCGRSKYAGNVAGGVKSALQDAYRVQGSAFKEPKIITQTLLRLLFLSKFFFPHLKKDAAAVLSLALRGGACICVKKEASPSSLIAPGHRSPRSDRALIPPLINAKCIFIAVEARRISFWVTMATRFLWGNPWQLLSNPPARRFCC